MPRKPKATPDADPTPPPNAGGKVGAAPAKRGDLADLKLYRMALAQGWDVPAAAKDKAIRRMVEILDSAEGRDRTWTAAAKTLVSMTTATTGAIGTALAARAQEELAADVEALKAWKESQQQGQPGGGGDVAGD
jgi:hypothetical protein